MIGLLAHLIGATIAMTLLTAIASLIAKRLWTGVTFRWGSVAIAYVGAVVLSALGNADGGPIIWTVGVVPYGISALIVGALWHVLARHKERTEQIK